MYTAPTSGGKSLVSDILMIRRLIDRARPSLLVLPYVALCEEKRRFLETVLQPLNYTVQGFYGGQGAKQVLSTGVGIAICTIEAANKVVNALIQEERLHDLGCVVVDELHMVGDPSRGEHLERLLSKLMFMRKKDELDDDGGMPQIIGMSATLPNLQRVADWLQAELYETDYRPTALEKLVKVGNLLKDASGEAVAELPAAAEGDPDHLAFLTHEVAENGDATLIFCPTKKQCQTEALKLAGSDLLTVPTIVPEGVVPERFHEEILTDIRKVDGGRIDTERQRAVAVQQLSNLTRHKPSEHAEDLKKCIKRGIAFHHAGLSAEEREVVERAYKGGAVRVLTATSTLAAGVNLPAKRVIFREPKLFTGDGFQSLHEVPTKFQQMAGRAGRSGIDSSGQAIILVTDRPKEGGFRDGGVTYRNRQEKHMLGLLTAECEDLQSCLSSERGGMHRAMLDMISIGAVSTLVDMEKYIYCTLYERTDKVDNVVEDTTKAMNEMLDIGQVAKKAEGNEVLYFATKFGEASVGGMMDTGSSSSLREELQKAGDGLVLNSDLHLIYLITCGPMDRLELRIDHYSLLESFIQMHSSRSNRCTDASATYMKVMEAVGLERNFVESKARGQSMIMNKKAKQQATVCGRFYLALILDALCKEMPIQEVVREFKVDVARIEALQDAAGYSAAHVCDFCEKMEFKYIGTLLEMLRSRVAIGVRPEIVSLTEIKGVKAARARALYRAGLRTPELVVMAGTGTAIRAILANAGVMTNDPNNWKENHECSNILKNAKALVKEKQKQQEKEREGIMRALQQGELPEFDLNAATRERAAASPAGANATSPGGPGSLTCRSQMPIIASFLYYGRLDGEDASAESIDGIFRQMESWKRLSFFVHTDVSAGGAAVPGADVRGAVVLGISLCGTQDSGAYGFYLPLAKPRDVALGRSSVRVNVFDAERWGKLMRVLSKKGLKKYTWDLKGQLFAIRQQFPDIDEFCTVNKALLHNTDVLCMRLASWLLHPDNEDLFDSHDARDAARFGYVSNVDRLEAFVQSRDPVWVEDCRRATDAVASSRQGNRGKEIRRACRRAVYAWQLSGPICQELRQLELLDVFQKCEMRLVPILVEAERFGIGFDSTTFSRVKDALEQKLRNLKDVAFQIVGETFDIDSPDTVSEVIYRRLRIAPPPGAKKGIRGFYGTGSDVLEEIVDDGSAAYRIVPLIMEYRSLGSMVADFKSLCVDCDQSQVRLDDAGGTHDTMGSGLRGRTIRPHFMQTSSATGRVLMDAPNMQKVHKTREFTLTQADGDEDDLILQQVEHTANLRAAFVARDGYVFVGGDYAQAELRLMAHFSKDATLDKAFDDGNDPFRTIAAKWLNKELGAVTTAERNQTKQLTYGLLYGMGSGRLAKGLRVEEAVARQHMESFKKAYPTLFEEFDKLLAGCREKGYIATFSGRKRFIPEINSNDRQKRSSGERKAINSVFQVGGPERAPARGPAAASRPGGRLTPRRALPVAVTREPGLRLRHDQAGDDRRAEHTEQQVHQGRGARRRRRADHKSRVVRPADQARARGARRGTRAPNLIDFRARAGRSDLCERSSFAASVRAGPRRAAVRGASPPRGRYEEDPQVPHAERLLRRDEGEDAGEGEAGAELGRDERGGCLV